MIACIIIALNYLLLVMQINNITCFFYMNPHIDSWFFCRNLLHLISENVRVQNVYKCVITILHCMRLFAFNSCTWKKLKTVCVCLWETALRQVIWRTSPRTTNYVAMHAQLAVTLLYFIYIFFACLLGCLLSPIIYLSIIFNTQYPCDKTLTISLCPIENWLTSKRISIC